MEVRILNYPVHDSKKYLNVMDYTNEVIDQHELSGCFNFANIVDIQIAARYGLTKVNNSGERVMSDDFYECVKVLEYLGVLTKTDSCNRSSNRSSKYSIDKHLFLLFYSFLLGLENLTPKQIKLLHKKEVGNNIKTILLGISERTQNCSVFEMPKFKNVIVNTYTIMRNICKKTLDLNNEITLPFNRYVYHYGLYIEKNILMKPLSGGPYNTDKYPSSKVPFLTELGINWFTNKYLEERMNDSKTMENYYEKYLVGNKYFEKLLNELEKHFNRTTLEDMFISMDLFNSLPGKTEEKKKELLANFVKYWMIKNCPFLNYTMGLVDDIKDLDDNYKLNNHIIVLTKSNQYGPYGYAVHFSGRMNGDICQYKKAKHCEKYCDSREYKLAMLGFDPDVFFDLHGSIFTIAKVFNTGEDIDLSFDIKKELEKLKIRGTVNGIRRQLTYRDYKGLGFYCFFPFSVEEAYRLYKNRYNALYHKILKKYEMSLNKEEAEKKAKEEYLMEKKNMNEFVASVSKSSFKEIYYFVQKITGGTHNYAYNIFVIESAIMALLVKTLREKGKEVKVVYDCVWWKSSQATKEEIEACLIRCTRKVMKKYYECPKSQIKNTTIDESEFFDKFGYIIFDNDNLVSNSLCC